MWDSCMTVRGTIAGKLFIHKETDKKKYFMQ
jgi:hypothetical protein